MASSDSNITAIGSCNLGSGPRSYLDIKNPPNMSYQSYYTIQDLLIDIAQITVLDKDMGLGQYTAFSRYMTAIAIVKA